MQHIIKTEIPKDYEAIIEVIDEKLEKNPEIEIKTGMQASISIIGDKRN